MSQITRFVFGAKCSPTCVNYALQRTVRVIATFCHKISNAVLEKFFIDNKLDSLESPEKAINRSNELLQVPGFNFTNPIWDNTGESFFVSKNTSCAITDSLTKRLVLSHVFDPFTVAARLLI